MMWDIWWIWLVGALAVGILEMFIPGFIFLGFAIGAAVTGMLLGIGGPIAAWMAGSLPVTALVFAVFSLVAWLVLRSVMGVREGQLKLFDKDINED